jgi:hypothetical protein
MMDCPRCYLPREDSAWQCDGCGYEFSQDFEAVRASLRAELKKRRTAFGLTMLVNLGLVGGVVFLALHGWIYISVPLLLAVIGSTGHAAHRISVVREHLRSLDRRHVPLPTATAQLGSGSVRDAITNFGRGRP